MPQTLVRNDTREEKRSVVDGVVSNLAQKIFAGALPAGATLPGERTLSSELNVGRAPLREALSRLQQMGLLRVQHGQASRVTDFWQEAGVEVLATLIQVVGITPEMLQSVLEARIYIGGAMARAAALRITDAQLADLQTILSVPAAPDIQARIQRDLDAFDAIVEGSGNKVYRLILNSIRAPFVGDPSYAFLVPDAEKQQSGLRTIVDAIAARDPEKARLETEKYLRVHSGVADG